MLNIDTFDIEKWCKNTTFNYYFNDFVKKEGYSTFF